MRETNYYSSFEYSMRFLLITFYNKYEKLEEKLNNKNNANTYIPCIE